MYKLMLTDSKALLLWELLDAMMRSGLVKNPDSTCDMVDLRRELARIPYVSKLILAAAKAKEAENAVEKK